MGLGMVQFDHGVFKERKYETVREINPGRATDSGEGRWLIEFRSP